MPPTRISILRSHMEAGRWTEAVRVAVRFQRLGPKKKDIERAWEAIQRPQFCRQLERDPDQLIAAGIAAPPRRYGR
jgi:hypothetical protein